MQKKALLCLISLLLFSCKEKLDTFYSTDTLDCISVLIANNKNNQIDDSLKTLSKYKKDYKFAADLEGKMRDKAAINQAEKLAVKGDLLKARTLLADRLANRGFSEVLNESQDIIEAAIAIAEYKKNSFDLSLSEASREFEKIIFRSEKYFNTAPAYKSWISEQQHILVKKVTDDKNILLRSLAFTAEYTSLYKPHLLDILILETAALEKSKLIPRIKDSTKKITLNLLLSQGLRKARDLTFSISQSKQVPDSLIASFRQTRQYAKAGKVAQVLASLQELQKFGLVPETYRKEVLKTLFLAIGWNNTSLINRNFLDLSVLLETVYKTNQ